MLACSGIEDKTASRHFNSCYIDNALERKDMPAQKETCTGLRAYQEQHLWFVVYEASRRIGTRVTIKEIEDAYDHNAALPPDCKPLRRYTRLRPCLVDREVRNLSSLCMAMADLLQPGHTPREGMIQPDSIILAGNYVRQLVNESIAEPDKRDRAEGLKVLFEVAFKSTLKDLCEEP